MVSVDTAYGGFSLSDSNIRIESELDIQSYLQDLNYALDVYIKIRVELLAKFGNHTVFIMSFHYAEKPFNESEFPYLKKGC